jgi:sugar (pentulose or hexulose) kinase
MSFVLLDVGGTFVKAAFLAEGHEGVESIKVVRHPITEFSSISTKSRTFDPRKLLLTIESALSKVGFDSNSTSRLLVTGQMAGLAMFQRDAGPVSEFISWQDEVYTASSTDLQDLVLRTGDPIRPNLPIVRLSNTRTPDDWVIGSFMWGVTSLLVNRPIEFAHVSDCAALGLLDVLTADWDSEALLRVGLRRHQLPTPSWDTKMVGLIGNCEVYVPYGDHQMSLFGGNLTEDEVSVNIATGGQVSQITANPSRKLQFRPYVVKGSYLQTRTHLTAGRRLNSALETHLGRAPTSQEWTQILKLDNFSHLPSLLETTLNALVNEYCTEIQKIMRPETCRLVFTGGVAQNSTLIRSKICEKLGLEQRVVEADDAAIAGLRRIAELQFKDFNCEL